MDQQSDGQTIDPLLVAGMIAALTVIDGTGFHGIDGELSGDHPTIQPMWAQSVRNAWIAIASIQWPPPIEAVSKGFLAEIPNLYAALVADDGARARTAATTTHAAQHALSDAGWELLARNAGLTPETPGHGSHRRNHGHERS